MALILALGVLATLFVMVITAGLSARILYERSHNEQVRIQSNILTENGAELARNALGNQQITEETGTTFSFKDNEIETLVSPLSEGDTIYSSLGMTFKEGDATCRVTVRVYSNNEMLFTAQRDFLINLNDNRKSILSLSATTLAKVQEL